MGCRIHSYGTDLRSRCRGAPLKGLEGQALEEHERGALTLEESDYASARGATLCPWD